MLYDWSSHFHISVSIHTFTNKCAVETHYYNLSWGQWNWAVLRGREEKCMFAMKTYLWPVLWFPRLRSFSVSEPKQESLHSSSRLLCSRRWPCRTPDSSGLHRHCGEPHSSCGPVGRPVAECLPVYGSKHQRNHINEKWTGFLLKWIMYKTKKKKIQISRW